YQYGTISRINPTTGERVQISTGGYMVHPWQIALDQNGNIVVADFYFGGFTGAIIRVDAIDGSQTVVTTADGLQAVAVVTPPDKRPPILSVPNPGPVVEATSPAGTVVSFTVTATDPDDAAGAVSCYPASGSTFAVGTKQVDCSSTDTNGNTGTASFIVTVRD